MSVADDMARHRDDFNQVSAQILLSDLELAFTFADVAARQNDPRPPQALLKARRAFQEISRLRWMVSMEEKDAMKLDAGLLRLEERLAELGERFDQQ